MWKAVAHGTEAAEQKDEKVQVRELSKTPAAASSTTRFKAPGRQDLEPARESPLFDSVYMTLKHVQATFCEQEFIWQFRRSFHELAKQILNFPSFHDYATQNSRIRG